MIVLCVNARHWMSLTDVVRSPGGRILSGVDAIKGLNVMVASHKGIVVTTNQHGAVVDRISYLSLRWYDVPEVQDGQLAVEQARAMSEGLPMPLSEPVETPKLGLKELVSTLHDLAYAYNTTGNRDEIDRAWSDLQYLTEDMLKTL